MGNKEAKKYLDENGYVLNPEYTKWKEEMDVDVNWDTRKEAKEFIDRFLDEAKGDEEEETEEVEEEETEEEEVEEVEPEEDNAEPETAGTGKAVPSTMIKNLVEVVNDYVRTQYELSRDEKSEIINNMKVSVGDFSPDKKGLRVVATSRFTENGTDKKDVEIVLDVRTEKGV